jgi:hypothetical protein
MDGVAPDKTVTRRSGSVTMTRKQLRASDVTQRMLSFVNLVELHVLDSIRRQHNVELDNVRKAEATR